MNSPTAKKNILKKIFSKLFIKIPKTKSALLKILQDASQQALLTTDMVNMIENIMQVAEMRVREVMIPKTQMVTVSINNQLGELIPIVINSGHSRFPVFDNEEKNIIGILLAKDLLKYHFNDEQHFDLKNILRPAMFTSQSKRLDILLREFRTKRNHLAIVLDEYAHVAGLVTIEDVLEQIVGEIEDEYDIDEHDQDIKQLDTYTFIVKAVIAIEDFNRYFQTHFRSDNFDTLGGILLQKFGHLPKRGEHLKLENLRFKILNSDHRRIHLIEVKKK